MNEPRVALKAIQVDGLFGRRDPLRIELDKRRPTVLTGANGSGKSTILGLVNAVSKSDATVLATAPYERLELEFETLPPIALERISPNEVIATWNNHEGLYSASPFLNDLPTWALTHLEDHGYDAVEAVKGFSPAANGFGATYKEYRDARSTLEAIRDDGRPFGSPAWMLEFSELFPVLFVTDQRLVAGGSRGRAKSTRLAVDAASADLAERLQTADSDYARASQQRERRFPQEVIKTMLSAGNVSERELTRLIEELDGRRESLRRVGLLDGDDHYEPSVEPQGLQSSDIRKVLHSVFRASRDNLKVLEEYEQRLSAFKDFLDERFFPKAIELNRSHGIRFSFPDGKSIRPRQLSSGEQQMVVLAYEILFRAQPNTLVIIDEPEMSLHVLWQDTLIQDLLRMGAPSDLQFLVATHSPMILAGHKDLERALPGATR